MMLDAQQSRCNSVHLPLLLLLILSLSAATARAAKCFNRLDVAIAVDTGSSESAAELEAVKSEVKSIISGFTLGKQTVQVALIEASNSPKVIAHFATFTSAAVDRLKFSSAVTDMPAAMKLAKDSVFSAARTGKISKVLILVKDRRHSRVVDSGTLARMKTEASALKAAGVAVHAVGVAGLWDR